MRRLVFVLAFLTVFSLTAALPFPTPPLPGEEPQVPNQAPQLATLAVTPTNNLEVSTATYLGGAGDDQANAVDVAPDGVVVLGGAMPGFNPGGATPVELLGGGDGVVVRLNSAGQAVLSVTRLGNQINDLEINDSGLIAVCGDFGVATLNAEATTAEWNDNPGVVGRCAIDTNGNVAALVGGTVYVYDASGSSLGNWSAGRTATADVAVSAANGGSVFLTGYQQKPGNLQYPFIMAWSYSGTEKWTAYNVAKGTADTRGERIAIGRDGQLYFAASINGGTGSSSLTQDPLDPNKSVKDRTVKTDRFNDPYNIGSVKMTWYGRYDPASGALILGQSLLTRLSSGKGNSIGVNALMADQNGRLYVAGGKAADLENRDQRQISGNSIGDYESGEGYVLVVSPDFKQRIVWTAFARAGTSAGGSPARGVGVRNGVAAVALTHQDDPDDPARRRLITTGSPLQTEPAALSQADSEAYLAVWPQIGVDSPPTEVTMTPSIGFIGRNTFKATVFPATTLLPLTYTWRVNGSVYRTIVAHPSRIDTIVYTWPITTPSQSIEIEAENAKGKVSAAYNFDVIEAKRVYLPAIKKN